jgi:hypothetical protein
LAARLVERTDLDDAGRIDLAYRLVAGREAQPQEIERTQRYLADYAWLAHDAIAAVPAGKPSGDAKPATEATRGASQAASIEDRQSQAAAEQALAGFQPPKAPPPAAAAQVVAAIVPDQIVSTSESTEEESPDSADPRLAAWSSFCQALLAGAEFRYVR